MNKIFKILILLVAFTTCKMFAEGSVSLSRDEVAQKIKELANKLISNEKTPDMAYLDLYLKIRSLNFTPQEKEVYDLNSVEKVVLEKVQNIVKNNKDVLKLIIQAKSARDLELIAHDPDKLQVLKFFRKLVLIGGFAFGLGCLILRHKVIQKKDRLTRRFGPENISYLYSDVKDSYKKGIITGGAVGLSLAMLLIND